MFCQLGMRLTSKGTIWPWEARASSIPAPVVGQRIEQFLTVAHDQLLDRLVSAGALGGNGELDPSLRPPWR